MSTFTTTGMRTVITPVHDLAAATSLYGALLGEPVMNEPYYVQFVGPDGQQVGLDPNGHRKGLTGPVGYWHVDDMDAAVKALVEAGASEKDAPSDVGGGRLVATLTDADGNPIGLIQDPQGWS
ncbi:MAG: glyoxalase [Nocardioidaceae bacterium]|nr:glyoxalase [Nocardioidaceae bacterium]NUS51351.1 glyoxalase [Nocardioidaceae bacterium]